MRIAAFAFLALMSVQFGRPQDLGRIYVYAERETAARSWRPISCDGAVVAKIKRGTFFAVNVKPGRHVLSYGNGVPAFVDVATGQETFLRLDYQVEIGEPATQVLSKINPDLARKEMRFVIYIDAKAARSLALFLRPTRAVCRNCI
ncbi:MAG TPA: hypothetical protein VFB14_18315 [Bryobacteraceae bacterium]|jgi:hypothetical protein|nr:hypothetical protein [Bryobacteraceae bacterium]